MVIIRYLNVPVINFFTFSACAAAMDLGVWRTQASDVQPGEARLLPGLPEAMAITCSNLKRKPLRHPRGGKGGPTKPGDWPSLVPKVEGTIGLMFNTCADRSAHSSTTWGPDEDAVRVGARSPARSKMRKTSDSAISDGEIRRAQTRVELQGGRGDPVAGPQAAALGPIRGVWQRDGPERGGAAQLAGLLEESTRSFIWVIGSTKYGGDFSDDMESGGGDGGPIITGWAPQLPI
ncbi:uncharacterized protein LOC115665464 [Syzygium oleosum]|uniref:uncharacterized protein LOC115665464 n=1 Tax=Syzygium oleosum TaxID=219896 RepID=UPI0024BA7692|nr:uncharacterized protein LOC115665464 [Syzygium oleosum]